MAHVVLETRPVEFDLFCAENDEWAIVSWNTNVTQRYFCSISKQLKFYLNDTINSIFLTHSSSFFLQPVSRSHQTG